MSSRRHLKQPIQVELCLIYTPTRQIINDLFANQIDRAPEASVAR